MKKSIIFFSFLSCFYSFNLQSMKNNGKTEIWDDGEVIIHEGDGFFSDDENSGEKKILNGVQELNKEILTAQNVQIVEQVKKQSWFSYLVQKIKKYGDLIFTQEGFIVLITGIVASYGVAIKCGYDPLNVYQYLENFLEEYDKIGMKKN